jgi:glucuronokinase
MNPDPVGARAHSRIGVLGNPSDGYGGQAMAVSLYNFAATVRIEPSDRFRVVPGQGDALEFPSFREATDFYLHVGCDDGLRLVRAAVARFRSRLTEFEAIAADDPRLRLSISYETSIPRQVGLAGSSAIIIAVLRALADWFRIEIPRFELAELALAAEVDDLGHPAGAMDRVIQVYEGFMAMDLREPRSEAHYTRLDAAALPPLFIAWDPRGAADSGRAHGDLRARWLAGAPEVLAVMEELRDLVDQGVECLRSRDADGFRGLIERNFELRTRIFDVGPRDHEMVAIARAHGAAAKLCGSGGAILGVPADAADTSAIIRAFQSNGYACELPKLLAPENRG